MAKFYVQTMGEESGPFSGPELKQLVANKSLLPDSFIRQEGGNWVVAESVQGLHFAKPAPPPINHTTVDMQPETKRCPYCAEIVAFQAIKCKHCGSSIDKQTMAVARTKSDKKLLIAVLLLIFTGWFGVHAFYSGNILQGFVYPIFGFLGFMMIGAPGIGFLIIPLVFWIGDFIRLVSGNYKDSQGRKITQWT
jgi:TM2 domain-containing membrane protein YozV